MCGDYDSVIGMGKEVALARFPQLPPRGLTPALGPDARAGSTSRPTQTGLARRVAPLRVGGRLAPRMPRLELVRA